MTFSKRNPESAAGQNANLVPSTCTGWGDRVRWGERTRRTCGYVACLLATGCGSSSKPAFSPSDLVQMGPGRYSLVPPSGETGPTDSRGQPAEVRVTSDFQGHPQTNDWWSSLLWSWDPKERFSTPLYPHPLSVRSTRHGLDIGYPNRAVVQGDDYAFPHEADLLASVVGLDAPESRVAAYADWTVTNAWTDGRRSMRATFGHGLPYVYVTDVVGDPWIAPRAPGAELTHLDASVACFTVREHNYCVFSPVDAPWERMDAGVVAPGAKFYSVAVLPDDSSATRELFARHAYAFVTGSEVSYRFVQSEGRLEATYSLHVDFKGAPEPSVLAQGDSPERSSNDAGSHAEVPLQALYRHQVAQRVQPAKNGSALLSQAYVSPRGEMKLLADASFVTATSVGSLLPILPPVEHNKRGRLEGFVKLVANSDLFVPGAEGTRDSYWEGKSFGRALGALQIADQLAMYGARDRILRAVQQELEDWFDGNVPRQYFYDQKWHTLIGTPTMYHSGAMMNDHHFHYGYYIYAAAIVALYDEPWAERWAPMVELLIRDAGSWDRNDELFPFLRYFDPYAGHSWANSTVMGERGNNQESSAEDLNFAAALALWGAVMERPRIRDTGLYLHTTLKSSVTEYWYDVGGAVYPEGFDHPGVGIVWGNGGAYTTWFSYQPAFIHGIQLTPMHAGMLFMGAHPKAIDAVMSHARAGNKGDIHLWRDIFYMFSALSDPREPRKRFEADHAYDAEFGTSLAYVDHFVSGMESLGRLDPSVQADTPLFAVFDKDGKRTHVAFNASSRPTLVTFSDGTKLEAQPRSFAQSSPKTPGSPR